MVRAGSAAAGALEAVVFEENPVDDPHLLEGGHVVVEFEPDVLADAFHRRLQLGASGSGIHVLVDEHEGFRHAVFGGINPVGELTRTSSVAS